MDNKISSAGLAAMLALATGKQKQLCEDFVRELFSIVEEELAKGENVRIKGFGTFKLVEVEPRKSVNVVTGDDYEIPGHIKIVFVMAKELAALVNAPFNAFEAVEIADALPTDMLDGFAEVSELPSSDTIYDSSDTLYNNESEYDNESDDEEEIPVISVAETDVTPENDSSETVIINGDKDSDQEQMSAVNNLSAEPVKFGIIPPDDEIAEKSGGSDVDDKSSDESIQNKKSFWKRYQFILGITIGICVTVLIGWLCFSFTGLWNPQSVQNESPKEGDNLEVIDFIEPSDTVASETASVVDAMQSSDVPTQPSDSPVYDTVTTTRYLTTIAKEHYGNFNLWPIIYEENASILGHPDRIKPGTRVVVPPLSKYNVDPNDKNQVNAMKQKGKEIYDKFK